MGQSFYFGKKNVLAGKQYRTGTLGRALSDVYGDVDLAMKDMEAASAHMMPGPVSNDFCLEAGGTIPLPWAKTETGSDPSVDYSNGDLFGNLIAALGSTSESQTAAIDWNDKLYLHPADYGIVVEMGVIVSPETGSAMNASAKAWIGLMTTYNATATSMDDYCFFNIAAGGLVASLDHNDGAGATDESIAAAYTFPDDTPVRLLWDMRDLTAVKVYAGDYGGEMSLVADPFDMSGMASGDGLQPAIVVSKSTGTSVDEVTLDYCKIWATGRHGAIA